MRYVNDANLNPAAWLLFEIFKSACVPANVGLGSSAKMCLQKYRKQFRAAIRVLVWLDLAVYDRKGALGCTPTDLLMSIIAERPQRRLISKSKKAAAIDRDFMETIIEAALKQEAVDEELTDCAVKVLGAAGLIRHHPRLMRPVPTQQLRYLVSMLRMRERKMRYGKIEFKRNPGLDGCYVPIPVSGS
jgi:hypothetical protein